MKRLEVCGPLQVNVQVMPFYWLMEVLGVIILLKMVDYDHQMYIFYLNLLDSITQIAAK